MNKGVSLFLTIIILAIILAVVFGLSAILISQIETIREMGNSVIAFYAADTGIERVLKIALDDIKDETIFLKNSYDNSDIGNNASYEVKVVCCGVGNTGCYFNEGECYITERDEDCKSSRFCIRSVGKYGNTKRAIEVEIFPVE